MFQFKWALGKETSYAIQRVYRLWRKKGNPFISISMSVRILSLRYCIKRTLKLAHFDIMSALLFLRSFLVFKVFILDCKTK